METADNPPNTRRKRKINEDMPSVEAQYRMLYFEVIDNIVNQLNTRFTDFSKLAFLNLVDVKQFSSFKTIFPQSKFESLIKLYGKFFDSTKLKSELIVFYSNETLWNDTDTVSSLLNNLIENSITDVMPELTKLFELVLTIPATSVSTERSFSALKRIKDYKRNTMDQNRLSDLALLSIEKTMVKELEKDPLWYDNIINYFAMLKERRVDFIYK